MVARTHKPHPYLKEPILFVDNSQLTLQSFLDIFTPSCSNNGTLSLKIPSRDELGWCIGVEFSSISDAEKALSCCQSMCSPGYPESPHMLLKLSMELARKPVEPPRPDPPVYPRLVQGLSSTSTLFDAYDLLRSYGPVYNISVDETLGTSVEFYTEEDACAAEESLIESAGVKVMLRKYDPYSLFCESLPIIFTAKDLEIWFGKFGEVTGSRVKKQGKKQGKKNKTGVVTFKEAGSARKALKAAMNGYQIGNKIICVNFANAPTTGNKKWSSAAQGGPSRVPEPSSKATSVPEAKATPSEQPPPPAAAAHVPDTNEADVEDLLDKMANKKLYDLWVQPWKTEADRVRVEIEELRARETSNSEELVRLQAENKQLRSQLEDRDAEADNLRTDLDRVSKELEEKMKLLLECENTLKCTEEGLNSHVERLESKVRILECIQVNTENRAGDLYEEVVDLTRQLRTSESRCRLLNMHLERLKQEEARRIKKETEEARRKEVEDARRRMEEMNRVEKERAKAEAEARRVEEQKAREKAERERLEREQREKERMEKERSEKERLEKERLEKERLEKERLEKQRLEKERLDKEREEREQLEKLKQERAWRAATLAEVTRCRERDLKFCGEPSAFRFMGSPIWNHSNALERFEFMVKEFESIKFSVDQPLTFENIPWPSLAHPYLFKIENVDWDTVDNFFYSIWVILATPQYNALVEKAHRLFHPDRWRARNLLNTVMDEKLKKSLEAAGNTVSQAITPVWRESKSKSKV